MPHDRVRFHRRDQPGPGDADTRRIVGHLLGRARRLASRTGFGLGRCLAGASGLVLALLVGLWLLRDPQPSPEQSIPLAGSQPPTQVDPPPTAAGATPATDPPASTTPSRVVVHVAGAVMAPGVYVLDAGVRVDEAIRAAGGPAPDADLDALNLAAPVADGERVYVVTAGEVEPAVVGPNPAAGSPGPVASSLPPGPVDVNRADAAELDALPGVGPATAQAIIDHREANGPFASVDELEQVRGIGPAKLDAMRSLVTV